MKGQIIIPSLDRDCTCLGVPEWSKLFNHEWLYLARTAASEIHMGIYSLGAIFVVFVDSWCVANE